MVVYTKRKITINNEIQNNNKFTIEVYMRSTMMHLSLLKRTNKNRVVNCEKNQ